MRIIGAGVMSLLLLAVCDTALGRLPAGRGPVFRPGPPAHAPAYGLRRKQVYGLELTFDAGLGLYVVVGHSDWYHHEGRFYRLHAGVWQISLRGDVWEPVVIDKLPPGLQTKAKALAKTNGKSDPGGKGNSAVKSAGDIKPTASPGGGAKDPAKAEAGDKKVSGNANAGKPTDRGNAKPTGKGKKK